MKIIKTISLSIISAALLFGAENNNSNISSQINKLYSNKKNLPLKEEKSNKSTNIDNTNNTDIQLAKKNLKYVLDYKTYLNKLKNNKLNKNKPIILLIGTKDCVWTKKEMMDLLGYKPLWNEIKNNFTIVYADLIKDQIPRDISISITPTIYILSPFTGNQITSEPISGYVDKDRLVNYLKIVSKGWKMYLEKINKN